MALDFGIITRVAQLAVRWVVAYWKNRFKYQVQLMGMAVKKAIIYITIFVLSS